MLAEGQRAPACQFIWRDGRKFHLHYAFRICVDVAASGGEIKIMPLTARMTFVLKGRNLERLIEPLMFDRVLWIKESEAPKIDDGADVFISSIELIKDDDKQS